MKLMRVGPVGRERPALLAEDGTIRDLSNVVADLDRQSLPELHRLAHVDPAMLPELGNRHRIGSCVARPGKFVCIGLNYKDHAAETGATVPEEPVVFLKATSAVCGPNDPIIIPPGSVKTDWEVELGVVIARRALHVATGSAMEHVAGYCVVNDVSERAFQLERGGTWDKGKGYDSFGPIGPWLVTRDEIPDPQDLRLWLEVDGVRFQDGSTRTMVFPVAQLVSYVSQFMSLEPGDVISTGTPPGVGLGRKPPVFLRPGQEIRLGIDGLGEQRQITVGG